jgi:hypothetical protein
MNKIHALLDKRDYQGYYAWIVFLIIVISAIGLIITFVNADSNSPSSVSGTLNNGANVSSTNNVVTGQYMCSQEDHDEAVSLDPDPNNIQKQSLDNQTNALKTRSNELDAEKAQLDIASPSVDQNDQAALDAYNTEVNNYNAALRQYNVDQQALSSAIDTYNVSEQAHNNYLLQHCTPL